MSAQQDSANPVGPDQARELEVGGGVRDEFTALVHVQNPEEARANVEENAAHTGEQFVERGQPGLPESPERADKRGALLLPLLTTSLMANRVDSNEYCLLHFATVIGCLGMLRPHTFAQLKPGSFTMVTYAGGCTPMPDSKRAFATTLLRLRRTDRILGFFIGFQSKTMWNARAYLPSLSSVQENYPIVAMCPIRARINITARGLVIGTFLKKVTGRKLLSAHLKLVTGASSTVAPYALRIGGRTWKISNGMDRQLVDFLGTWKCPDASARYCRANPRAILLMVREFYITKDPARERNGEWNTGTSRRGSRKALSHCVPEEARRSPESS